MDNHHTAAWKKLNQSLRVFALGFAFTAILAGRAAHGEAGGAPNETYLYAARVNFAATDEAHSVVNHIKRQGKTYVYEIYELKGPKEDGREKTYWEIVVYKKETAISTLRCDLDEAAASRPSIDDLVREADVDFDGQTDILIYRGTFGAQQAAKYSCYTREDGRFVLRPGFEEILNPSIDQSNRTILSSWRNDAASYANAMYRFQDGDFAQTDELTREYDADGNIAWIVKQRINGVWQVVDQFTNQDRTSEEIEKIYCDPTSYWGLDGQKWAKGL